MNKKNICILYGGKSGEHDVSVLSAASVASHLDKDKYNIVLIGINRKGKWFLQPDAAEMLAATGKLPVDSDPAQAVSVIPEEGFSVGGLKLEIDFVFPILHGTFGEDGTVQGLLELTGLPYAGSGVLGSSVGMDKEIIKKIWMDAGLPTVPFISLSSEKAQSHDFSLKNFSAEAEKRFGYPLFIKPIRAGSSVGISRADSYTELEAAAALAFRFDSKLMIEPAIDARELECSVIGNMSAEAFTPGEIAPTHDFYDYEAKYLDENGASLIIPADIPNPLIKKVRETAVAAYLAAGVEGMARVDFFLDRRDGRLLLNEINTIPGFTSISMFPKMCEAGGLPYADLLDRLIQLGESRLETRKALSFSLEN